MKLTSTKETETSSEKKNKVEEEEEDVYEISSGDEDCSRGMKSKQFLPLLASVD